MLVRIRVLMLVREHVLELFLERGTQRLVTDQCIDDAAKHVREVIDASRLLQSVVCLDESCGFIHFLQALDLLLAFRLQIALASVLAVALVPVRVVREDALLFFLRPCAVFVERDAFAGEVLVQALEIAQIEIRRLRRAQVHSLLGLKQFAPEKRALHVARKALPLPHRKEVRIGFQDIVAEAMEGEDSDVPRGRLADQSSEPSLHRARRRVRKGEDEDVRRIRLGQSEDIRDPEREDMRLSGSGSGDDEHRPFDRVYRRLLCSVQLLIPLVERLRILHASILRHAE